MLFGNSKKESSLHCQVFLPRIRSQRLSPLKHYAGCCGGWCVERGRPLRWGYRGVGTEQSVASVSSGEASSLPDCQRKQFAWRGRLQADLGRLALSSAMPNSHAPSMLWGTTYARTDLYWCLLGQGGSSLVSGHPIRPQDLCFTLGERP